MSACWAKPSATRSAHSARGASVNSEVERARSKNESESRAANCATGAAANPAMSAIITIRAVKSRIFAREMSA